jgi:hypothetical protein
MIGFISPSTRTFWQHHRILSSLQYAGSSSQHPVHPLPLPAPNIQHQAQCDPGANISATNSINVFQDTVDLEKPFPISSADHIATAMMASIRGTFVIPLSDGIIAHPFQITLCHLNTSRVLTMPVEWILSRRHTRMLPHSPVAYM